MSPTTYTDLRNRDGLLLSVTVYLSGRRMGIIKSIRGGWKYVPRAGRIGGEVFATVEEVKRALEDE